MNPEYIPLRAVSSDEPGNRATRLLTLRGRTAPRRARKSALLYLATALALASGAGPLDATAQTTTTTPPATEAARPDDGTADLARVNEEIARHPGRESSRFERARILENLALPDAAIQDYRWLLDHRPERPEAYNNLARLLAARGELPRAIALLEQGLATHPVYHLLFENLRSLYGAMAQKAYRDALTEAGSPEEVAPLDEEFGVELQPVESMAPSDTSPLPGAASSGQADRMAAREE